MPVYELDEKRPVIGEGTWIAPSAEIIGDVVIGKDCHIGFGAIIRGDFGQILIGDESVIEDSVVIHCQTRVVIGRGVIVGHMVMLHDTTIRDCCLIGMKSILCDHSEIGEWSIVAEQSRIKKHQVVPNRAIFAGSPAEKIGEVTDKHVNRLKKGQNAYMELTRKYLSDLKKIRGL